jgi:EmrB/QacA subfamily drug resistance transporter
VLLAIGVGSLLGSIDNSVVNAVLPVVRRSLGSNVATIEWVVSIYVLVVCGLLLSFGRLGDLRGHKQLYITGFVVFTLSSAFCGLAWHVGALIAARGLQAVGACLLFANAPAILTRNFPAHQRGQALGLQAVMIYLGLMIGPPLGGWLTEHISWRAAFYINVPIGIVAVKLCTRFIPRDEPRAGGESFDFAGGALFMGAFTVLLLALNQGYIRGWRSPSIQAMLAGAGLLLVLFVVRERLTAHPLLDLTLFEERRFAMSAASAVLNYVPLFSITFLMPFYLIQGRGLTPSHTGLLLTIQPAFMVISSPISGTLSDRIGTRPLATLGMGILGVGVFLLSRLQPDSPVRYIVLALSVVGLGTGIFITPNNSALLGSAPPHRQGIASGVLGTARYVGMVLGVGIAGAIFTTYLERHTSLALFEGIRASFLVGSLVGFLGCVTSAASEKRG